MNTTNMLGFAITHTLVQGIKSQASTALAGLEAAARGTGEIYPREPTAQLGLCALTIPIITFISTKVNQYITKRADDTHLPAAEAVPASTGSTSDIHLPAAKQVPASTDSTSDTHLPAADPAPASTASSNDKPKANVNRRGGRRGGRGRYKGKSPQKQPQAPSAPPARPAFKTLPEKTKVWNHFAATAPTRYTTDANQAWKEYRAVLDGTVVQPEVVNNTTLKEKYKCTKKAPTCEAPPPPPPERKSAIPPHLRARAGQSNNISET